MTLKCQIQWIDRTGRPTPDTNPAIGRCRTIPRTEQFHGRGIQFSRSEWFPICAEHAKLLSTPGMHIWEFERFTCDAVESET